MTDITCPECGVVVKKKVPTQKYCCLKCKRRAQGRRHDQIRRFDPQRIERKKNTAKKWRQDKINRGLCSKCGKFVPANGNRVCSICIEANIVYKG